MPNSLSELEAERSKILRHFTSLGDLRPGSICAVPRRCGKPSCHCAKPDDPGHDPQTPHAESERKNRRRIVSFSLRLA
jgi:hypothetical protein